MPWSAPGTTASTANGRNQLATVNGAAATHDARGNLTFDPVSGNTYGYSSENLLTSASGGVTFGYDPLNRLQSGSSGVRFAYDGLELATEYNSGGVLIRRYVHGPGMDEPLVEYDGGDTSGRRFLHADERGSIVLMTQSSGAVWQVNPYDEFGQPGASNSGRFQYTGQVRLTEVPLYYYKARIYDPQLGRFLQTDPIGYDGGANLYAYVLNDPVNLTDPLGLQDEDIVITGRRLKSESGGGFPAPSIGTPYVGPEESIVVTGRRLRPSEDEEEIVVTARRLPASNLLHLAAGNRYYGPSFCSDPTWAGRSFHFPLGRITSGKEGDVATAIADIDRIAIANGIPPLGEMIVNSSWVAFSHSSWLPIPLGNGWWAWKNYYSGYINVARKGLGLRVNPQRGRVNVDIPKGYRLPDGRTIEDTETCHYR